MATSTLVQFLSSGEAGDTSNRRQVETFLAGGAIAAGDWVALDNSKTGADRCLYVVEAAGVATKGNAAAMGVALAAAAADERVDVVVAGYVASASVAAATVAGDALVGPIHRRSRRNRSARHHDRECLRNRARSRYRKLRRLHGYQAILRPFSASRAVGSLPGRPPDFLRATGDV